jgi:hypothetical protein
VFRLDGAAAELVCVRVRVCVCVHVCVYAVIILVLRFVALFYKQICRAAAILSAIDEVWISHSEEVLTLMRMTQVIRCMSRHGLYVIENLRELRSRCKVGWRCF